MPRAPIRPIGAHTPVVGGLATASLKYAAVTLKMLRQSARAPGRPLGETVGSA